MTDRAAALQANLDAVRARIARCAPNPDDVTLVAVSKERPARDVMLLASLGVTDFGESYESEAGPKAAALAEAGVDVRWHFVGQMQRNKAARVARYAHVVQSVDRPEVAFALANAATRAGRTLDVLVQVRFDRSPHRAGVEPGGVAALAGEIVTCASLRLAGVMCVAPLGEPARPSFARLREVAERLRVDHPGATTISAGMTGDFEDALAEGANCVRIGTALFGDRAPAVR